MLEGARMQISFLKDLATLRNPASRYTFLQYAKARGRLEQFVNINEFRPTRLEYNDYLKWVAESFADRVRYGAVVTAVVPLRDSPPQRIGSPGSGFTYVTKAPVLKPAFRLLTSFMAAAVCPPSRCPEYIGGGALKRISA
ncbi:L-lysine 6-monooxygenase family protein [Mycobacterium xenopi 3993]|nr:L-lysine 6-monooxygenase family protein [Mycobacterium xenopi 3993]